MRGGGRLDEKKVLKMRVKAKNLFIMSRFFVVSNIGDSM